MRFERPGALRTRPRVSVVVPCYNYARFLPDAVRSAITQDDVDVDVLIVDDASVDGSGDIAGELAKKDPQVRVLQHDTNKGHLRTYNDGLQVVNGDYVVLLSADDLLAPGSLARACGLLEAHPEVGFVYGYAESFDGTPPTARQHVRSWSVWHGDDWFAMLCRTGRNVVVNPEVVMRRAVLSEAGGYDLNLPHSADMYLWLRAAQIADVGRINGTTQAFYRVHGANMHLNEFAGVLTDMRERLKTWDSLLCNSDNAQLHQRARRGVAKQALEFAAAACDRGETKDVSIPELLELAQEAWPNVTRTVSWHLMSHRSASPQRRAWMRLAEQIRTLRHKVRWRRWRRYGI